MRTTNVSRKRLTTPDPFFTVWVGERNWANPEFTTRFPTREGALRMGRRVANDGIATTVWNRYGNVIYQWEPQRGER